MNEVGVESRAYAVPRFVEPFSLNVEIWCVRLRPRHTGSCRREEDQITGIHEIHKTSRNNRLCCPERAVCHFRLDHLRVTLPAVHIWDASTVVHTPKLKSEMQEVCPRGHDADKGGGRGDDVGGLAFSSTEALACGCQLQ